jgi:hypothetical protein
MLGEGVASLRRLPLQWVDAELFRRKSRDSPKRSFLQSAVIFSRPLEASPGCRHVLRTVVIFFRPLEDSSGR